MIRDYHPSDNERLQIMLHALWSDYDGQEDLANEQVFVWDQDGVVMGFILIGIRPWVDGAESSPCPHIEGWYVEPELRRQGVGRALVRAAEDWCKAAGYTELTSDVLVDNDISLQAHVALGFTPTERVQYFKKIL
jgi:aminoglycoside 6'-N-acetyltransferase I